MSGSSARSTPSRTRHAFAVLSHVQPCSRGLEKSSANSALSGRLNSGDGGGAATLEGSDAPRDSPAAIPRQNPIQVLRLIRSSEGAPIASTAHHVAGSPGALLDHSPYERKRLVRDLAPLAVDRQRVSAAFHREELGHAGILLLLVVRGMRHRGRDRVVLFTGDDQQGA